jgi:hypothetical protein
MERYVWAILIAFVTLVGAATALIIAGRSAEMERLAIFGAQGVGFLMNFYLVFRSNKNTEVRMRHTVENGVQEAVRTGIETAAQINTPPPGTLPKTERKR